MVQQRSQRDYDAKNLVVYRRRLKQRMEEHLQSYRLGLYYSTATAVACSFELAFDLLVTKHLALGGPSGQEAMKLVNSSAPEKGINSSNFRERVKKITESYFYRKLNKKPIMDAIAVVVERNSLVHENRDISKDDARAIITALHNFTSAFELLNPGALPDSYLDALSGHGVLGNSGLAPQTVLDAMVREFPEEVKALGDAIVLCRAMPFEITRDVARYFALTSSQDAEEKLDQYEKALRKVITGGTHGGMDYWDYSIIGSTITPRINISTKRAIEQSYFGATSDATGSPHTSKLALTRDAWTRRTGIFLVGKYSGNNKSAEGFTDLERFVNRVSWKRGYFFRFGKHVFEGNVAQLSSGSFATSQVDLLERLASVFVFWWQSVLPYNEFEQSQAAIDDDECLQAIKIDVDSITRENVQGWRHFIDLWYDNDERLSTANPS